MSNSNNVRLGPCRVYFAGVDLGLTQGGVEVDVKTDTHQVMTDQYGKTVINEIIVGRNVTVKAPLAETTLDNLVRIMPGATLVATGGVKASGTVTFSAASVAGDSVTVNGVTLTAAASVTNPTQFAIGTTAADQATKFAAALNNLDDALLTCVAVAAAAVVTLTATGYDSTFYSYNSMTLTKTGTSPAVSGATFTGGVVPSKQVASVPTAVGVSLLAIAQSLVLHPIANADSNTTEDFVIPLAATSGGMKYTYTLDKERIFDVSFQGYPDATGLLYQVGR